MLRIPVEQSGALAAPAWIEVDLDAIAHNVRAFRRFVPAPARLVAVVKANAYGHGMLRVARAALAAGADDLAVASVLEGAALRAAGITAPILIAGPIFADEAGAVVQHGLVPSLATTELAAALARATRRYLPVQIEVDTGMSRYGVPRRELPAFVQSLHDRGRLTVAGVYTHFAGTEGDDAYGLREQLAAFDDVVGGVRALRGVRQHACNTLATLLLPEAHRDAVRIGGGLYGFDPLRGGGPLSLRPALTLKARIIDLRQAAVGDGVGYGATFVCRRPTRLALLPIGYADGLARELWQGADVLVRGRKAPIVGLISMNLTVVDVTDAPAVLGEEVVLLGSQGGERLSAEQRTPPGGSCYEVTSLLRPGLPRRYLGGTVEPTREGRALP
ncbi:MAG: alanine racemase [Planctomycetes bacterium]|nr:alanine racemase [Planctomycetota bacterium]